MTVGRYVQLISGSFVLLPSSKNIHTQIQPRASPGGLP